MFSWWYVGLLVFLLAGPFVLAFVMPLEVAEGGGASFAGGRLPSKSGDIVLRGRDGNQVVLQRVLLEKVEE